MCVSGEKCIEVVGCGDFPHFPQCFPHNSPYFPQSQHSQNKENIGSFPPADCTEKGDLPNKIYADFRRPNEKNTLGGV